MYDREIVSARDDEIEVLVEHYRKLRRPMEPLSFDAGEKPFLRGCTSLIFVSFTHIAVVGIHELSRHQPIA